MRALASMIGLDPKGIKIKLLQGFGEGDGVDRIQKKH